MGGLFVSSFGAEYEVSRQAVLRALQLGVNYIDTAPTYFDSEEVLGRALEGVDAPFYLSSKIGGRLDPFLPHDPDCLRRSVEESLARLKRDHLDILMVHEPDRPGMYDWWADNQYNGPVLDVIDEFKEQGIVDYIGLGSTTAYHNEPILRTGRFDRHRSISPVPRRIARRHPCGYLGCMSAHWPNPAAPSSPSDSV